MAVLLLFEAVSFSFAPALVFQFPAGRNQDAPLTQLRHIKGLFFHRGADSSTVSSESSEEAANHGPACAETLLPKTEKKKKENKTKITWRDQSAPRPVPREGPGPAWAPFWKRMGGPPRRTLKLRTDRLV